MKTTRNNGLAWFATVLLPRLVLALAMSILIASCAQDVKITAPRYALLFGITNYENAKDLNYPIYDVDSLKTLLTSQGWNVTPIKDNSATKATMLAPAILLPTLGNDAVLLLYFSGHGALVPGSSSAFLAPYDTTFTGLTPNISSMISSSELFESLSKLPTKNIIVILDSCYAGSFSLAGSSIDSSPQDYSQIPSYSAFSTAMSNFGNLLVANASASGGKTPIVLSAAGSAEQSYETSALAIPPDLGHGVFTYYLLQSATNGDSDGDGFVTMTEAYSYTVSAMKAGWNSNPANVAFLPHLSGGTRDLVLFSK